MAAILFNFQIFNFNKFKELEKMQSLFSHHCYVPKGNKKKITFYKYFARNKREIRRKANVLKLIYFDKSILFFMSQNLDF